MKKFLSLLLAALLVLSLAACAAPAPAPEAEAEPTAAPTAEPAPAPAPTAEPAPVPTAEPAPAPTEEPKPTVADGTYTATAPSFSITGMMTCEVTFEGGKLADIVVVEETDSQTSNTFTAIPTIYIPRLLEAQSLAVDAVSGATASSMGVRTCVADAIVQAGGDLADWYAPIEKSTETKVIEGYDVIVVGLGGELVLGTPVTDIDTILEVGEQYGNVIKFDDLAALASAIGCDEAALRASVGESEIAYAVIAAAYSYGTVGGLDVDVNMNVLRTDGTAIENLYAVGQDSEGVCNASGKAYTPWGGQAQSWTFVSGRIAGQNAAAYGAAK